MAKKKKQNLQKLIAKKQQLQHVAQAPVISFEPQASATPVTKPKSADVTAVATPVASSLDTRYRQTAWSVVLIVILLVVAVLVDKKTAHLTNFGDWLYSTFQLGV